MQFHLNDTDKLKPCSAFQEVCWGSDNDPAPPDVVMWCAELEPETVVSSLPLALVSQASSSPSLPQHRERLLVRIPVTEERIRGR